MLIPFEIENVQNKLEKIYCTTVRTISNICGDIVQLRFFLGSVVCKHMCSIVLILNVFCRNIDTCIVVAELESSIEEDQLAILDIRNRIMGGSQSFKS